MKYARQILAMFLVLAAAAVVAADEKPGDPARGKLVYQRYCVSCHGDKGNGEGEFAEWITPRPRDYRQGTFKWRSTQSGSLPLVSDLEKTIQNGVYGTYMPTWLAIGHQSRMDVIAYIMEFSPRWKTDKPEAPIKVPPDPGYTEASVKQGRMIFEKFKCAQCHGDGAQGDGPSSHELKDDWGNAIVPYDLTQGHIKCGDTPEEIYTVFNTGLNGTPMPSYADSISPAESWDLVHYIESLSPEYPRHVK